MKVLLWNVSTTGKLFRITNTTSSKCLKKNHHEKILYIYNISELKLYKNTNYSKTKLNTIGGRTKIVYLKF